MKNKKLNKIQKFLIIFIILDILIFLIFSLIIPKQIAKTVATSKITKAFSGSRKWEYKNMQWSDKYKKWFIYFKQQDQDNYQTIQLSPKYFPISGEYKQLGEEYSKRQEVKRGY